MLVTCTTFQTLLGLRRTKTKLPTTSSIHRRCIQPPLVLILYFSQTSSFYSFFHFQLLPVSFLQLTLYSDLQSPLTLKVKLFSME